MKTWYRLIFYIFIFTATWLQAAMIDIEEVPQSLLEKSSVVYDQKGLSLDAVKKEHFQALGQSYVNRAFDAKTTVWVRLDFVNRSQKEVARVLEVDNPRLEEISLYDGEKVLKRGMLYVNREESHIYPSCELHFQAGEQRTVYLAVKNRTTALQFELFLKSLPKYYQDDVARQNGIIYFLGIITAFMTLSVLLYFYLRDDSYLYYAFYLMTLIFQQMTYVGFLPLHAPQWFTEVDNVIAVPKISIMIIAAAMYAMHFLGTKRFPKIHRTYQGFIVVLIVLMPVVGTSHFYLPEVTVLIGLGFIIFNTLAGVYIYRQGDKQARFFIAGWMVLIVAYLLMIADTLGVISGMHKLPSLLLWATSLEALLLLLAFVDRFSLLQDQKEHLHDDLVLEYNLRQKIIENEVEEQTDKLSHTLGQKELLFHELHHRVKNNLQLILSMIRLQHDHASCDEENTMLQQLEGRIGAIARTHELLYQKDGTELVDMQRYVEDYVEGMDASVQELNIQLTIDVHATLPLKEAVYVGLIINELVTNAVKYAYDENGGVIHIRLNSSGQVYVLEVCDEGKGYNNHDVDEKSLGLTFVYALVEEQLDGSLSLDTSKGTHYTMRFVV